jgi:hypothetical protein
MLITLSACNSSESGISFSAEEVDPLSKTFNLDQYAENRYSGNYEFAFSFKRYNSEATTIYHNLKSNSLKNEIYIWNLDFRNEFRDTIIQSINELEKIKNKVFSFRVEFDNNFVLTTEKGVVLTLEKSRVTAMLKILLPASFDTKVSNLIEGLNTLAKVLETDDSSTNYDIVKLQVDFNAESVDFSLDTFNYIEDCLYGFKNLDDILAFIDGKYNFVRIKGSAGDNTIDIFKSFSCYIHYGEHYWIKVINIEDVRYIFNEDGDVNINVVLYEDTNEHYLNVVSVISLGAKYELKKDVVYFIKLSGMFSNEQGDTTLKMTFEEITK